MESEIDHLNTFGTNNENDEFVLDMKRISKLFFPCLVYYLIIFTFPMVSLVFLGKKYNDKDMINGVGLVHVYINITFVPYVYGFISVLETYASNAKGVKNYRLIGIYIQRAEVITTLMYIILLTLQLFFSEYLLQFMSDAGSIIYARRYINYIYIYCFIQIFSYINIVYLNISEHSYVNSIAYLIALLIHPILLYLFINVMDLDVVGAGLSYVISNIIAFIILSVYIYILNPYHQVSFFPTFECFKQWGDYLKLAFWNSLLVSLAWWPFESLGIFCANYNQLDFTVFNIYAFIYNLYSSMNYGVTSSTVILVGTLITRGSIERLGRLRKRLFIFSLILLLFVSFFTLSMNKRLFSEFMDDDEVVARGSQILIICCIQITFDLWQDIASTIFRGLGLPKYPLITGYISYLGIQTFACFYLGFYLDFGVVGIVLGNAVGHFLNFLSLTIIYELKDLKQIKRELTHRALEKDIHLIN